MGGYPQSRHGYFHLTGQGWVSQEQIAPLPAGCMETWRFDSEQPSENAKERVCLRRVWYRADVSPGMLEALHSRFGEPIAPTPGRNIILECDI